MKNCINITWIIMSKVFCVVLFCFWCSSAWGQDAVPKRHRFAVYGGIGPNYYFNNLVKFNSQVNEVNYSFVARFMWEPEHLLMLGFEAGYYRLYSINFNGPAKTSIRNSAIPFQLVVGIKFARSFYYNFGIGRSLLINDISTKADGDYDASVLSLADFTNTLGYKKKFNDRWSLSSELKLYYASKASDMNLALAFVAGYSFGHSQKR